MRTTAFQRVDGVRAEGLEPSSHRSKSSTDSRSCNDINDLSDRGFPLGPAEARGFRFRVAAQWQPKRRLRAMVPSAVSSLFVLPRRRQKSSTTCSRRFSRARCIARRPLSLPLDCLPSRASWIATCVIAVVSAAPCQCFSFAPSVTTSPCRISSTGPPHPLTVVTEAT